MMHVSKVEIGNEMIFDIRVVGSLTKKEQSWLVEHLGITDMDGCYIDEAGRVVGYVRTSGPISMLKR